MSYAVPAPAGPVPVAVTPRRPTTVVLAAALLAAMALIGLGYAVVTLVVVPGVVDRFRAGVGGVDAQDVDGVALLVWVGAGLATVLAVVLFILYAVLAVGLRRGSNAARMTTWVVCGLGLLAGCGTVGTMFAQGGSSDALNGLGAPLYHAYPSGWLGTNIALGVAQMIGYAVVAGLLMASPGHFFGGGDGGGGGAPAAPAAPGPYGAYGALPGMPGLYDTPAATQPYPTPSYPAPPYSGGPQGHPGAPQGYQGVPQSYPGAPQGYPGAPQGYQGAPQGYPPAGPLPPAPGTPLAPPGYGAGGPPPAAGGAPSGENGGDDQYWARPPS